MSTVAPVIVAAAAMVGIILVVRLSLPSDKTPRRGRMSSLRNAVQQQIWPTTLIHAAPAEPFTIFGAHLAMQRHRHCRLDHCARKSAAFDRLVSARHAVPEATRTDQ
ncbi:hypothetical protein ACFYV7_15045 [Nocardia suismassiliense]|uniref:Secreted protein n=1 Tax=Nocardia suismassiliense TaxID=2077092 RepID=A0ABW6QT92_9NOCA